MAGSFRIAEGYVEVTADETQFNRSMQRLQSRRYIVNVGINLDDSAALARLNQFMRDRTTRITADLDTRAAADDLALLTRARTTRITADADTDRARADLDELARNRHINVRVDIDRSALSRLTGSLGGAGGSSAGLGSITSSLTSLTSVVIAALPMMASLAQSILQMGPAAALAAPAVLSLGAAFAALKLGTSGIGDAFKVAFAPATKSAASAESATRRVEAAQRSLAKAQQAVKDAEVNAAEARVKAARDIQDAQLNLKNTVQQVADANRRAAEQVAQAERDLADAQRAARQAQVDLNDARKQAAQDLEDLNNRLIDAQLNQRQKVLDLEDAEKNLAAVKAKGAAASAEELAKAQLQYDQAVQALSEQQTETERLQQQTDAANKAGVEGSKQVTDAKQKVADANQSVKDKTQALTDAEIEAARAQQDGAQKLAKAQRDVADAQAAMVKAVTDGQRQIADAQQNVADATQALADAQKSGALSTNKTADALAKLAPQARAFVNAVLAQRAAWRDLKLDVQNALFAGLGRTFTTLSTAILPTLHAGLTGTATILNQTAKNAANAVVQLARTGALRRMFDGLNAGMRPLTHIPGQIITGLTQISIAASPAFARLTTAAASTADRISKKLADAFTSGRLEDAINTAVGIAKQFGKLFGDAFATLNNIFKAAAAGGGNALGMLGSVFAQLRRITAMPEVQKALTSIFTAINSIARLVATTLGAVIQAALPLLAALAPVVTELADKFGPVLAQLAGALGKALAPVVAGLLPVVSQVGGIITGLVKAVMPLLPPLGKLIGAIVAALAPVVSALGAQLVPVVAALAQGLAPIVGALVPVVQQLGQFLGQLAPLFPKLMLAFLPLLPPIAQLTVSLLKLSMQVITPLMPLIVELAGLLTGVLAGAVTTMVPAINTVITALSGFVDMVTKGVHWIVDEFKWMYDVLVGHSIIPDLVKAIVTWFTQLWTRTKQIFTDLKKWVVDTWNSLWNSSRDKWNAFSSGLRTSMSGTWSGVKSQFSGLKASLSSTWNSLWNDANSKTSSVFSTIRSKTSAFSSAMRTAFGALRDGLGTIWKGIESRFSGPVKYVIGAIYNNGIRRMWNTIASKISSQITLPAISLGFNQGGIVPGTGTKDTVPAMLTPGERILSNEQVNRLGGHRRIDAMLGQAPARPKRPSTRNPTPHYAGGGIIGTITGAIGSAASWAKNIYIGGLKEAAGMAISDIIKPLINRLPSSGLGTLMKGMSNRALDGILGWLAGQDKKAGGQINYNAGAGVAQWKPQILQALSMLGQPAGWLGTVERRMNQESGGNPTIVNKWDINWQQGHPSVGLMQVIEGTFREYAGQFRNTGPFSYGVSVNPLANTYAGLNYALHRYGSLGALNRPGGYDSGGLLQPGATLAVNRTGKPERVLNADQTARLDALLSHPAAGGGITIEAIHIAGTFDFSSRASRKQAANELVVEIKEALRNYDRGRAR